LSGKDKKLRVFLLGKKVMHQSSYQFHSASFRLLGFFGWGLLLIMAIVFYKERAIFLDGAFQLEILINQKQLQIYHYRLTNPLTQVLALGALYLKLPLKFVLVAYSINFILLFAGIYYIIVKYCKNDFLGWVLLLFFTLMVLDSFYFLPPELYQGIAFLLLWWAILLKYPKLNNTWQVLGLALLMVPVLSDSRLITPVFLYCFVFFWLSNRDLRHGRYYALFGLLLVLVYIHGKFFVSVYDAGKLKVFNENLQRFFPNYLDIPANTKFLIKCLQYYYGYVAACLATVIGYIYAFAKQDNRVTYPLLKLFMVILANLFFVLLLHLGSPNTSYRFYAEVNYLPLTIFVCIPLFFDIMPMLANEKWLLRILTITLAIRLSVIAINHDTFKHRHQWYSQQMEAAAQRGYSKSILPWDSSPKSLLIQPWASAQESLLLSSLRGPEYSRTFLVAEAGSDYKRALAEDRVFITGFYAPPPSQVMNEVYFHLEGEYFIFGK
jgi:hypothetical protein